MPAGRVRNLVAQVREHLREGVGASAALLRSGDRLVIAGAIGYFVFDVVFGFVYGVTVIQDPFHGLAQLPAFGDLLVPFMMSPVWQGLESGLDDHLCAV